MKVLILTVVVLAVASCSAKGSGPYLPSGWKPEGPAFLLPTELEKPVAIPLKDAPVEENVPSGSDFLREYGPPTAQVAETEVAVQNTEVSQDITQQALPEQVTDQAFVILEASFSQEAKAAEVSEAISEEVASVSEAVAAVETNEQKTESEDLVQGKSLAVETQTESSLAVGEETTEKLVEAEEGTENTGEVAMEVTQQEISNSNVVVEQSTEVVAEMKVLEAGVKNIAEALVGLENEIKSQQVQSVQEVSEVRTGVEASGSVKEAPEGFLEYGPPGFTEYGPPKGQLNVAVVEETNEVRRRRFSPKFKTPKRKN